MSVKLKLGRKHAMSILHVSRSFPVHASEGVFKIFNQ